MSDLISSIIEICSSQNITQRELAEKSGLTEVSISRYFNGERIPNIKNAEKMASALGLRIALINTGVINITESDYVCEWKYTKEIMDNAEFKVGCNPNALKRGVVPNNFSYHDFKYCPYCGKQIKVVE